MGETNQKDKPNAGRKSFRRNLIEWAITLAIGAAILYFFAPSSWWQFGVANRGDRIAVADFTLRGRDGVPWNFSRQRGSVLIVNYWASWCGPCRFETPGLVSLSADLETRGVRFVGVSVDDDLTQIRPFVDKYRIPYPILLPGNDPNIATGNLVLPTTFLYDRDGKLAKRYTGIVLESTLRSDIESILSE